MTNQIYNPGLRICLAMIALVSLGNISSSDSLKSQTLLWQDEIPSLPKNYDNFIPPSVGEKFKDSAYGTTIRRISNGASQLNDSVHHEYATMSPFNSDNSLLLLLTDNDGFMVTDLRGRIIIGTPDVNIGGRGEPRWSCNDPNLFYFHEDNHLMTFDVSSKQKRILRSFTQFNSITFGGGESDLSEDGENLMIVGDERQVGVYSIPHNLLGTTMNISGHEFDYFDLTPNNNVVVRWGSAGKERFQGIELFDREMRFKRQIVPFGTHADRARDVNGDEVLVMLASNDLEPAPGCENNGIEKIRLSDSKKTCLLRLNWNCEIHVSANGQNPFVLISTTDNRTGTASPPNQLFPDWRTRWLKYYNEIILVKLDGSVIRPIAHHRSRSFDSYWHTPRAAISRDGMYAVFDSNFGTQPLPNYSDVFLVNLKPYFEGK
jgi:hypothetical protein